MPIEKIYPGAAESQGTDLAANNIAQLRALFPELMTEGKAGPAINVDVLKALVGDATVTDADEKYGLNWHGKRAARQLALTPSTGTLRPCPEDSVDWDTTQNLMIEGDNLEVLKLLQKSYAGKVKLIYIDPPYNTGKDFVYPDNFHDSIQNYMELTGQVEGGRKISSNNEASGRFHTDWLNMIYPRLLVARNFLSEDGLLVISIDDNEIHNLRRIADEVMGEENFIGIFVVNSSPSAIDYGHMGKMHEYALFYAKDIACAETHQLEEESKEFKYKDAEGPFNIYPLYNGNVAFNPRTRPNLYYPFYLNPIRQVGDEFFEIGLDPKKDWVEVYPVVSRKDGVQRVWRWGRDKARSGLNGEIVGYQTEDGEYRVVQKSRHTGKVIRSLQLDKDISSRRGTAAIDELFGKKVFSFPKSVELIRRFVAIATNHESIVMDFFAGSATTAHAVMLQNHIDQGQRKFIVIQLPEPLSDGVAEQLTAAEFCDSLSKPRSLATLTRERILRAGRSIVASSPMNTGDMGFRTFRLDTSNLKAWGSRPTDVTQSLLANLENVHAGRSTGDVLNEMLLKLGLDLCVPIESKDIAGKSVKSIGGGVLLACLDEQIAVADAEPLALGIVAWVREQQPAGEVTCVFRDSAFDGSDVAKTNLAAILEQHGIAKVRSL